MRMTVQVTQVGVVVYRLVVGVTPGLQVSPYCHRITKGQRLRSASPPIVVWKIEDLLG